MGGEGAAWIGQAPFTETQARLRQSRRRHLYPLRHPGDPRRGRGRRQHHLQDPVQRRRGDDRRPAGRRHPDRAADRRASSPPRACRRIVVVTDEPENYADAAPSLAAGRARSQHRDELDAVQRELRETPGVTVLIYDQTCAAEKRRRRKRGLMADPARAGVHQRRGLRGLRRLLEGLELPVGGAAGDRVRPQARDRPVELQQGLFLRQRLLPVLRHRAGRQAAQAEAGRGSATADLSRRCRSRRCRRWTSPTASWSPASAAPASSPSARCWAWPRISRARASRCSTWPAWPRRAARWSAMSASPREPDGRSTPCASPPAAPDAAARLRPGRGRRAPRRCRRCSPGQTRAVVNSHETITGDFTRNPDFVIPRQVDAGGDRRSTAATATLLDAVDATRLATALLGDTIATNLFMLGYAWQKGLVPVSREALERAIELNGTAVDHEQGRLPVGPPRRPRPRRRSSGGDAAGRRRGTGCRQTLDEVIARRVEQLTAYQDAAYAARYSALVGKVRGRGERSSGRDGADRGGGAQLLQAAGLQGRVRGRPAVHRRRLPEADRGAVRGRLHAAVPPGAADCRRAGPGDRRI